MKKTDKKKNKAAAVALPEEEIPGILLIRFDVSSRADQLHKAVAALDEFTEMLGDSNENMYLLIKPHIDALHSFRGHLDDACAEASAAKEAKQKAVRP